MSDWTEIDADQTEGPVSVAVTRRIKPGCERAYEELLKGIHEAIKGFDGYLGSHILRPSSPDDPEYRIIFRFDTARHLRAWEESAERREWLDRMSGVIVGTPAYQVLTGLETWFTLSGSGAIVPPPRYKMALVTWLAVFPLLTAFNYAFQPLFLGMPIWLRVMVGTALVVPLMTYVVMPRVTRLFKAWLYPAGIP
jgi:antibiotic biosynthesis monooxygenase (ABM) superfamily enzyme